MFVGDDERVRKKESEKTVEIVNLPSIKSLLYDPLQDNRLINCLARPRSSPILGFSPFSPACCKCKSKCMKGGWLIAGQKVHLPSQQLPFQPGRLSSSKSDERSSGFGLCQRSMVNGQRLRTAVTRNGATGQRKKELLLRGKRAERALLRSWRWRVAGYKADSNTVLWACPSR